MGFGPRCSSPSTALGHVFALHSIWWVGVLCLPQVAGGNHPNQPPVLGVRNVILWNMEYGIVREQITNSETTKIVSSELYMSMSRILSRLMYV